MFYSGRDTSFHRASLEYAFLIDEMLILMSTTKPLQISSCWSVRGKVINLLASLITKHQAQEQTIEPHSANERNE